MIQDYEGLKMALKKESYPHDFLFKFIGKNSPIFLQGVEDLQRQFPLLVLRSQRPSQNQGHWAMTFRFSAPSVDAIIEIFQVITQIPDLALIL